MNASRERLMDRSKKPCRTWVGLVAMALLLLLMALALTGCSFEPSAIVAVEPTATLYPPPPTDIPPPPPGPTPVALDFPIAAPTHAESERLDDQACVDCHTDEETLKLMAEEEEVPEVESEGEG
jgi:hypothetical protein